MPLDPDSQRRKKILTFLRDRDGSCSEKEWKEFDLSHGPQGPHLDTDMQIVLIPQGYVRFDQATRRYTLTPEGESELTLLEEASDPLKK